jgi:hypothetical protein
MTINVKHTIDERHIEATIGTMLAYYSQGDRSRVKIYKNRVLSELKTNLEYLGISEIENYEFFSNYDYDTQIEHNNHYEISRYWASKLFPEFYGKAEARHHKLEKLGI